MSPPLPSADEQWALFLDFDGTLVDIAEDPDAIRFADRTRDLLHTLTSARACRLALVSGRSIDSLDRFLDPLVVAAAGIHGAELRPWGASETERAGVAVELEQIRAELAAFVKEHDLLFEDKGVALALHYRRQPSLEQAVHERVQRALARHQSFALQPGKAVVEIKPAGVNKGRAIEALLSALDGRWRPVFVGDDLTDEPGFAVVNQRGGHSVHVGERDSRARYRLADVNAVHGWLGRCAAVLTKAS